MCGDLLVNNVVVERGDHKPLGGEPHVVGHPEPLEEGEDAVAAHIAVGHIDERFDVDPVAHQRRTRLLVHAVVPQPRPQRLVPRDRDVRPRIRRSGPPVRAVRLGVPGALHLGEVGERRRGGGRRVRGDKRHGVAHVDGADTAAGHVLGELGRLLLRLFRAVFEESTGDRAAP